MSFLHVLYLIALYPIEYLLEMIFSIITKMSGNTILSNANASGLAGANQTSTAAASMAARAAAQSLSVVSQSSGNTAEIVNGHLRTSDGTNTITITGNSCNINGDEHVLTWVQSGSHFYLGV